MTFSAELLWFVDARGVVCSKCVPCKQNIYCSTSHVPKLSFLLGFILCPLRIYPEDSYAEGREVQVSYCGIPLHVIYIYCPD